MPTLDVVMIVKDEVNCLGLCLDSVRAIADEIVVGDTGSTDETAAVAQSFGPAFSVCHGKTTLRPPATK